ncbi:MAG: C_GCAxxG_C_C family protein [Bacteroidales bacterium]|nr:C_GCAxxG_C_C family protein [Bacteroidales bacterium]
MSVSTKAAELFGKGYNCAQSTLAAFSGELGLDENTAFKIASGFGAGLGYRGEMCGAVVGAYMAIGIKYGFTMPEEKEKKDETYQLIGEFINEFKKRNKSIICKELINYDTSDPDQLRTAREKNVFREKCPKYVRDAAEIVEKIFTAGD